MSAPRGTLRSERPSTPLLAARSSQTTAAHPGPGLRDPRVAPGETCSRRSEVRRAAARFFLSGPASEWGPPLCSLALCDVSGAAEVF